jgi:hypothetical protein
MPGLPVASRTVPPPVNIFSNCIILALLLSAISHSDHQTYHNHNNQRPGGPGNYPTAQNQKLFRILVLVIADDASQRAQKQQEKERKKERNREIMPFPTGLLPLRMI